MGRRRGESDFWFLEGSEESQITLNEDGHITLILLFWHFTLNHQSQISTNALHTIQLRVSVLEVMWRSMTFTLTNKTQGCHTMSDARRRPTPVCRKKPTHVDVSSTKWVIAASDCFSAPTQRSFSTGEIKVTGKKSYVMRCRASRYPQRHWRLHRVKRDFFFAFSYVISRHLLVNQMIPVKETHRSDIMLKDLIVNPITPSLCLSVSSSTESNKDFYYFNVVVLCQMWQSFHWATCAGIFLDTKSNEYFCLVVYQETRLCMRDLPSYSNKRICNAKHYSSCETVFGLLTWCLISM